jgi:uncharacterized protein with PQ loop repeat
MRLWDIIAWVGPALLAIDMIPQVYKTFTSKSVEGVSLMTLILWNVGCGFAAIYAIHMKVPFAIILPYLIDNLTATSLLIGYWMYSKRNKDNV